MLHIGRDVSDGLSPVLVLLSGYVLAPRRASSPQAFGHSIPQRRTPTSPAPHPLLFVDQHVVRCQLPRNHAPQDRLVLAHLDWTPVPPDPPQQKHAEPNRVFSRHREDSVHTVITITRGTHLALLSQSHLHGLLIPKLDIREMPLRLPSTHDRDFDIHNLFGTSQ